MCRFAVTGTDLQLAAFAMATSWFARFLSREGDTALYACEAAYRHMALAAASEVGVTVQELGGEVEGTWRVCASG